MTARCNISLTGSKAGARTGRGASSSKIRVRGTHGDFSKGDDQPEVALNRAIWKSIKGRRSPMPRPRHERIIGTVPNDEHEEIEERERG